MFLGIQLYETVDWHILIFETNRQISLDGGADRRRLTATVSPDKGKSLKRKTYKLEHNNACVVQGFRQQWRGVRERVVRGGGVVGERESRSFS